MSLIASDGLTYKDLTQRLLGNPEETLRNWEIQNFRRKGHSESDVRAYISKFDASWAAITGGGVGKSYLVPTLPATVCPEGEYQI